MNIRLFHLETKKTSRQPRVVCWLCALLITLSSLAFSALGNEKFIPRQAPDAELSLLLKQTVTEADSFFDRFDAEVWLVDMSKRLSKYIPDPEQRLNLLKRIHAEAKHADLEPELVLALIHVESGFEQFAISSVGAQGLMQVMPFWKNEIGRPEDNLTDVQTNLRYGCTILKHYIKKEKGNLIRALGRYNGSLGKFKYPEKVLTFWEKYWFIKHV